jgi:UDP-3-O-[3-hydroxymyristoyl] N-acetylglucosamine deacetylase
MYPSSTFKISCTISFDHPLIKYQSYTINVSDKVFEKDICSARTFGFLNEIEYLRSYGFAKGGSLDNAVVIDKEAIINSGGLRYPNEFVRHKILDCIGDFSLLGLPIIGHVILNKSGHSFNHAFLREFINQKESWETRAIQDMDDLSRT